MDVITKNRFKDFGYNTPKFSVLNGVKTYARCVSVYDGDTCSLVIPYGDRMYKFSARLYGIDTCEMTSKDQVQREKAIRARNRIVELVTGRIVNPVLTKKDIQHLLDEDVYLVWVECFDSDKYGRLLVKISTSESSPKFSDILISEHLGLPYFGKTKALF